MTERVVIVGGTSGIGLATAARLLKDGYEVVVTGRTADRLDDAVRQLGGHASGERVDARDGEAMRAMFARLGAVDHVVIAASGRAGAGPLADLTAEAIREAVEDKLIPHLLTAQAALPVLRRGGSLTFISAASAGAAFPGVSGLAAVNGAIESIVPGLAVELGPIRVNAVSPGVIDTPWWDWLDEDARPGLFDGFAAGSPTGRIGVPDDVARGIAYLIESTFTTGTVLTIDGGGRLKAAPAG